MFVVGEEGRVLAGRLLLHFGPENSPWSAGLVVPCLPEQAAVQAAINKILNEIYVGRCYALRKSQASMNMGLFAIEVETC